MDGSGRVKQPSESKKLTSFAGVSRSVIGVTKG